MPPIFPFFNSVPMFLPRAVLDFTQEREMGSLYLSSLELRAVGDLQCFKALYDE